MFENVTNLVDSRFGEIIAELKKANAALAYIAALLAEEKKHD